MPRVPLALTSWDVLIDWFVPKKKNFNKLIPHFKTENEANLPFISYKSCRRGILTRRSRFCCVDEVKCWEVLAKRVPSKIPPSSSGYYSETYLHRSRHVKRRCILGKTGDSAKNSVKKKNYDH
jgi:hypothetical protein